MNRNTFISFLSFFLILGSILYSLNPKGANAAFLIGEEMLVLYDAASGAIPGAPLLSFIDFPTGTALPTYAGGVTVMDTTTAGSDTYAGWIANGETTPGFPILDRTAGFQVDVRIQVDDESHTGDHRSGFSLIILSEDARGIELAFWENEIWAQSDDNTGGLFRHGEGVPFATTAALTDYRVTIVGDIYTLTVNTQPILSGPVRDYSAFDGFPDPYETRNFLFLGDDTTSAQARIQLSFVSITGTEPITATPAATNPSTPALLPTNSPVPLTTVTPIASPTPPGDVFGLCPSGWILLAVIGVNIRLAKRNRAGR